MAIDHEGRAHGGSRVTYRVAVVGLGRIGWLADRDPVRPKPASHVSAWDSAPRAELVAVCDSATDRMTYKPALDYLSVEEMLRLAGPLDIVSVATPPDTHLEIVRALAEAKVRLIVCEKPLATTTKDAEGMVDICQKNGTILLTNHGRRFHHGLRQVRADLERRIGRPCAATCWYSGGLWAGGSHAADLLMWFLGPVERVEGAILWHRGGAHSVMMPWEIDRYVVFEVDILGERGRCRIGSAGLSVSWEETQPGYPLAGGYRHLLPVGQEAWPPTTFLGEMAGHAVAVLDGRARPLCTGEDGLAAVRVLEALEGRG